MTRLVVIAVALVVLGAGAFAVLGPGRQADVCPFEETLSAPSGRALSLCDVLYEQQPDASNWAVVRVLDPGLAEGAGPDDHDWACEIWGLPALEHDPRPARIVVQIMQAPFVRGEPAPGIRQAIEAYTEDNGSCLWELL